MSLSPVDNQAPYNFEPFFEANWLHNTKLYGVEMGGDRSFVEGAKIWVKLNLVLKAALMKIWMHGQVFPI